MPEEGGTTVPSFYLRFGTLDRAHFRTELFAPSPVSGVTGWFRSGVGFNQFRRGRVSGFAGVALYPYSYVDNLQPRAFADLDLRIRSSWDLGLRAQGGAGELGLQWSVALVASYETRF